MGLFSKSLNNVDPQQIDNTDLSAFSDSIGGARLVCLGESAHHLSELVKLHDRISRYLVAEHGFTVLAFESGYPEGLLVDQWICGGPGSLDEVARTGMTWSFGCSAERHAQLRWMREWNEASARRIGFLGMDVPGCLTTPLPAISACLQRIPPQPGDRELLNVADLGSGTDIPPTTGGVSPVPDVLRSGVDNLINRCQDSGDRIALQCARGARAVIEFLDHGLYPGPGRNLRNETMAENLRVLLERGERIVVSAHNVHIQRTPSFDGTAPIGQILANELGSDLVVIGTTHAGETVPGEPRTDSDHNPSQWFTTELPAPFPEDCLDAVLDRRGALHFTDIARSAPEALAIVSTMRGQHLLVDIDLRETFDAVIHVRHTRPVTGVSAENSHGNDRSLRQP